jgi:OOP family OmpA-OmpF porin
LTYGLGEGGDVTAAPPLESVYVSLFGGGAFPLDTHVSNEASNYLVSFKDGFTVGAAVGADIANKLRGELELSYLSYDSDKSDEDGDTEPAPGDVNLTFVMANVWRDFDIGGFQPYAGLGVGVAVADVDIAMDDSDSDNHINDTSLALAGQAGGGIRFAFSDNITLDAGYRFKGALAVLTKGDVSDDGSHGSASYYSHVAQIGLTWGF